MKATPNDSCCSADSRILEDSHQAIARASGAVHPTVANDRGHDLVGARSE